MSKAKPEVTFLRPLGDHVLVTRSDPQTATPGGILIPDTAQAKTNRGTVVAVGPGKESEGMADGGPQSITEVSVGDVVVFGSYAGNEIEHNDTKYLIMSITDILAVVK